MTAVTALTAQNTLRGSVIHPIPAALVRAQIRAFAAAAAAGARSTS